MCQKGDVIRLTNNLFTSKWDDGPDVDRCLFPFIERLNNEGIATVACCCGHSEGVPYMTAILKIEQIPKLLDDIEAELGWKNLRGFLDPKPLSMILEQTNVSFKLGSHVEVGIYAYAGFEETHQESMGFLQPFR